MEDISAIHLAVISDSSTDCEAFADLIRHQGITVSQTQFCSGDEFQCTNDDEDFFDIVLFCPQNTEKSLARVIAFAQDCKCTPPVIVIPHQYQRDDALEYIQQGATDVTAADEQEYLVRSLLQQYRCYRDRRLLEQAHSEEKNITGRWKNLRDQIAQPLLYVTEGFIVYANPAFIQLTDNHELEDTALLDVISADHAKDIKTLLQKSQQGELNTTTLDLGFITSNDKMVFRRTKIAGCVIDGEKSLSLLLDAPAQSHTGPGSAPAPLPFIEFINIEQFLEEAQAAINLARDTSMGGCIGIIEIDDFQSVKDMLGVTVSDNLLDQMSRFILDSLPSKVNLSRLGSGAFVVLLNFVNTQEALTLLEELRLKIANHRIETRKQSLSLTCSIGLVAVTDRNESVDELMAHADTACRVARQHGGNITHLYDPYKDYDLSQSADEDWKTRIELALSQGSFKLLFQPITNIRKRPSIHRYEVTVRMLEGDDEILPSQFLHAAKQSGIQHQIDKWIILSALQQLHVRAHEEQEIELFVKLSAESIQDNTFPVWLQSMFETIDTGPHRLCFEISSESCHALLSRIRILAPDLKNLGTSVCLEHVGKSKSDLTLLGSIQFDFVKIDGSLISHVIHDRRHQLTIKQIADQCKRSNTRVIAVSVQDTGSVSFLWQAGVTNIQGYYVRPPAPTLDFDFDASV